MKKIFVLVVISLFPLFVIAQTGYYRSAVAGSGNWSNTASWEYSPNNIAWGVITVEGYPGELGSPTSVLVRDGDTIVLDVSPANAIGSVSVGEGTTGVLSFGDDATIRDLTVTNSVILANGSNLSAASNALHTLSIGDDLTVNGTFDGFTSGTQGVEVTMIGNTSVISGFGSIEFSQITFNHTGTTTVSSNFNVQGTLSISNTGTLNLGSQTISGSGASDTFSMSTGVLVIEGTNTFPSGFETITLSGGTVKYFGTNQTVAHQESDGGNLVYNNLLFSENPAGTYTKSFGGNTTIAGTVTIEAGAQIDLGAFSHNVGGSWVQNGSIAYVAGNSTVTFNGSGFQQLNNPVNTDPLEFNNVIFNGGGVVSFNVSNNLYINGNFTVDNNTTLSTAATIYARGDFSVTAGSVFNQTGGSLEFDGAIAQAVDVSNCTLINLYFDNGSPAQKTLSGDLNTTGTLFVDVDADVTDAGPGQNHAVANLRVDGAINFLGTLTTSGSLYDNNNQSFSLGTVDWTANGGQINANTSITFTGDFTVNSGTFNILTGASLTGSGNALQVLSGARLDIDANNGFPTGFASYTLDPSSIVSYTLNGAQVIRGNLTYGELELGSGGVKTFDGPINVVNFIDLNNGVVVNAGTFDHTFRNRIYNNSSSTFSSTGGTVSIFASDGANYTLLEAGSYTFNNLILDTDTQTGNYVYLLDANLTINGNVDFKNSGGDALNQPRYDISTYTLQNDFGDVLTVDANVFLRVGGTNNIATTINTFASINLDLESTIWYDGTVNQTITHLINPYGNILFSGTGTKTPSGALNVDGNWGDNGGTYIVNYSSYTHTIAGNFTFDDANTTIGTSTMVFDGVDQLISEVNGGGILLFNNLTFGGTGTKTLDDNYNVDGNLIINAGVTVDATSNDVDFYVARNWTNNGTFTQTTGEFYFDGTSGNQNIFMAAGYLGQVFVNKPSGTRRVTMTSDLTVSSNFTVQALNEFRTGNFNLYVEDNFTVEATSIWTQNAASTIYFNGTALQELNLIEPITFTNVVFQNAGTKRNDNNPIDVNGNLTIETGSAFNAQNFTITVAGNWTNNGSFLQTGTVTFDGTNQTINASSFNRVVAANSGTKTLGGGVTITDDLIIDPGVTFDVSASNYPLTIGDDFTVSGTFNARNGVITFNGNNGVLTTGGATFYTVNFNKNAGQRIDLVGDLTISDIMTINTGTLETDGYDLYLSKSLVVTSGSLLSVNNAASDVNFLATSGTHQIQTSGSVLRNVIVNAPGAIYELSDDLGLNTNYSFTLTAGTFTLNQNTMSLLGTGVVTVNGGTFDVDENAILKLPNNSSLTNNGGIVQIVGLAGNPARVERNGATGGYTITQTSGTFHAQYYEFYNTITNGITISGGSIDGTNNFSNGAFNSGTGSQYLNLTGLNITTTADNVTFGVGPTYNVTRTAGTGTITFSDANGNLAGAAFENDGGGLIDWTFPGGVYWDAGAGTSSWNDGLNWSGNTVPDNSNNVILNHDFVGGAYTVTVSAADAEANRVTLDAQGGAAIGLTITAGYDLTVTTDFQLGTTTTLTIDDANSVLAITEDLDNSGTITHTAGLVRFKGTTGSHIIRVGSSSLYNLEVDANGATYTLSSALDINNDITLLDGLLDVSSSNYAVTIGGDWSNIGLTTFEPRSGTVTFDLGGNSTQTISGGPFYNLASTNGTGIGTATKQLSGNVSVENDVIINANTVLDAQTFNLFVGRNWTNNAATNAFTQSGTGTVTFNGAGNQTIDNGAFATTFNDIGFSSGGTVTLANNSNVNGDVNVAFSVGTFNLSTFTLTGVGGSNSFTVAGGSTLQLFANNFPTTFETLSLASNSTVQYRANTDQDIYPTTYGNLTLLRNNAGNLQTKTALGDLVVQGNLTVNDVDTEFDLDGYTLTITGNISLPNGGRAIQWGNGTVNQINATNFYFDADITEWPTLILGGTGNKYLNTNINVTGDITVQNAVNLRMGTYTITATGGVQAFNVDNGGSLTCAVITADGIAMPNSFDTYSMGSTSNTYLNSAADQTVFSGVTYGNLYIQSGGTATIDGDLSVAGDFSSGSDTFSDAGFDLTFSGSDIQLNNYIATLGTTITLDGTAQTLRETSTNSFTLRSIVLGGSGIKTMGDGNDTFDVLGDITINVGVEFYSNRNISLAGNFTNNGTLNHYGNTFTFDGTGAQSIATNLTTSFYSVDFTSGGTKTFTVEGATLAGNFTIAGGTTLNMGAFDYTLGFNGATFTIGGTLNSSSANFTLTANNPDLPANLSVNDLTLSTAGDVDMTGSLDVNGDLTIATQLDVNNAAYNLTVGGDFINNGIFNDFSGSVTFDGTGGAVTVQTNGSTFYNLTLNPSGASTYTLTSASNQVERALTVGSNATLDLNSNLLILGSALGSGKVATINGTLEVDDNAILRVDNATTAYAIQVNGVFRLVGSSGNPATLTSINYANARRTALILNSGSTIHARYYLIEYLNNNGVNLVNGSSVDGTNNFSDGTFANMVTINTGGPYYYMTTNSVAIAGTISNVNFGFIGTPTVGVHYNVRRTNTASVITFGGSISGSLGAETYENDPGNKITWPVITTTTWTGNFNNDWHNAANWSSLVVPTSGTDVTIPARPNACIVSTALAQANNLTISDGSLTLQGGFNLEVSGNFIIGTGTSAGSLIISNTGSEVSVAGSWTRGTNGIFTNGGSTVNFTATSGSVSITHSTSTYPFNHVNFTGAANYQITGTIFDVNGNLTISAGTFTPSTNNYTYFVAGDLNNTATMSNVTNGVLTLDGAAQAITAAKFDQLTVSGTGTKTFNGAIQINDNLIINSTLSAALGAVLDINGTVTINASGTFNNVGGGTHTVSGASWTNSGTYSGTGTINFDGGNQTINTSSFAAVELSGTGVKTLAGNLTLSGNLTLRTTFTRLDLSTYQITHSGSGTMLVEGTQTIYVTGANNFPTGFATYDLSATSNVEYRRTSNQTIKGGIAYGNLILVNANTKTLGGNITVQTDLTFNDATLDVSASNYTITIGDDWFNQGTGSFVPRLGDVIFNGSDGGNSQQIRSSLSGSKAFYRLTLNKDAGDVIVYDQNIVINDNLTIAQGNLNINGLQATVGGSFDNTGGSFTTTGTFVFTSTSGTEILRSNGSTFNNVIFNATGTTFTCQDDFANNANFQLNAGTFNGNGNMISLGNNVADILTIDGTFTLGPDGILALGQTVTFTINATGVINIVGAPGQPATVTRRTTGTYSFQVNGTIGARYHLFEYMDANGIVINSSATIHATNNFRDGSFTNGVAGGTFLRIENTQTHTIDNVNFPTNPGGVSSNVTKVVAASGVLTFTNATGVFAGEIYDDDPNNLVNWPTPVTLTWNGGTSTNWFTAANWTASAGPSIVPTGAENVVIATATNQPVVNTSGALANNLTINNGAVLTINTANEAGNDVVISSNLNLDGTLTINSASDTIYVAGSWLRGSSGLFNSSTGTVIFNGAAGSFNINSGAIPFYNLVFNSTSVYNLSSAMDVNNTLTIQSGTLDASASNYSINVGNEWINTGTFNSRSGTVTFDKSTAGTVRINNNLSTFYNMVINGGASTTFQIDTNPMTVNGNFTLTNSTFDLNNHNLIFGDGTGTDIFNINGDVIVDANAQIRMGANSTLQVQSGGSITVVGSDASNVATVTRNTTGTYAFLVSGGASIDARYYLFEYMNASGLQIQAGATIDAVNNFSDGTFSNGTAGGRYLDISTLTVNHTVANVVFNSGPTSNVRATSGTGNYVTFQDASGLLAGPTYEVDDGVASTGAVRWTSTSTQYTWTGAISTNWNVLGNWNDGIGVPLTLPDATIDVIIPNVANDPIISAANAAANSLTIQVGGILIINTNRSLTLTNNFTNGGTLTIPNGSVTTLSVGNNYSNSGTVTLGNASTVELTASSGIKSLAFGGSSLNNLTLNGAATFNLTSNLDINGSLTITSGTLDVTASNYTITVAGNWTNNGSFTARSGRVTFDGTGAQAINAGGSGATKRFYNFRIAKSNTATLTSDIYINNNVELVSGTLNLGSITLETPGTWNNTNVTVVPSTSTVIFSGGTSMSLTANSQSFNHLTINKTGGNQVSLASNTGVNGTLTITAGTLYLNGRRLDFGDGVDATSIDGTLYVDAGSTLGIHENSTVVVNNGGTLRVTGLNASNVATVTRRAATAGWQMTINGTLRSQYAVFEYSGGNGITIGATGLLHATDNLSNTIFRNGTGSSYITNNANITHTIDNITFNTGSPTYNITSTNGSLFFDNYQGTYSGARYENDSGPTHPGIIRWDFDRSMAVTGIGTYNFNNEVIVEITANSGLTNIEVDYRDALYNNTYNAAYRYYRLIYTGGTATANLTFAYAENELNTMTEANMKIWVHQGGTEWSRLAASTINVAANTLTMNGYTIGNGSAAETIAKSAGTDDPTILDGSEDFFISDEVAQSALPVTLTRFETKQIIQSKGTVVLEWETETEQENYGFTIQKTYLGYSETVEKSVIISDTLWSDIAFVQGKGNSFEKVVYSFEDAEIQEAGKYAYRLKQIDFDGESMYFEPIEVLYSGPEKFELKQNYPNPFNPTTIIPYDVAKRTQVNIEVYNILGQRVQVLVNEVKNPGTYKIDFNASKLASGMYVIRYVANGKSFVKKMLLVK